MRNIYFHNFYLISDLSLKKQQNISSRLLIVVIVLQLIPAALVFGDDLPETTYDGLVRITGSKVDAAYVKPGADFSVYKRLMIDLVDVRFKKGWEQAHREVSKNDQARIKAGLVKMFHDVFRKELQEKGGMQITTRADDDVLAIRAAIIDLDITAPDVMSAGRVRNFVTSAGEMSIIGELYDSVTGDILARVRDKKIASSARRFTHSTRISNSHEARMALSSWARLLNDRLNEIREKKVGAGP